MSLYSSRPPFDDDPEPWVGWDGFFGGEVRRREPFGFARREPRPEFGRPQHNPTNPTLVEFRAGVGADPSHDWCRAFLSTLPDWDEGSVGHARKVITRLSRIGEDAA